MNFKERIVYFLYKLLRRVYSSIHCKHLNYSCSKRDEVAHKLYEVLTDDKPFMIARYGAFEIQAVANAIGVKYGKPSMLDYIKGNAYDWVWNEHLINFMENNAGFFPATHENLNAFAELMIEESKEVDMLASWLERETCLSEQLKNAYKFPFRMLEPYRNSFKWTQALKGKRILVVHPFADTIRSQYNKRERLFKNPEIMPKFASLEVVKAVLSQGGTDTYRDWFEALDFMKNEINKIDFDICLIACGAYGFPIAAHVKRMGKKAIVWGGSLQIYFGVWGKRWRRNILYRSISTDAWVSPAEDERPRNYKKIENGCYW